MENVNERNGRLREWLEEVAITNEKEAENLVIKDSTNNGLKDMKKTNHELQEQCHYILEFLEKEKFVKLKDIVVMPTEGDVIKSRNTRTGPVSPSPGLHILKKMNIEMQEQCLDLMELLEDKKFVYMNNIIPKVSENKRIKEKVEFVSIGLKELERRNLEMQEQCNKMKDLLEEKSFRILGEVVSKVKETECEEMRLAKIPVP